MSITEIIVKKLIAMEMSKFTPLWWHHFFPIINALSVLQNFQ